MELVQRIEPTEFCLTYDTEIKTLYLRIFIGEDAGGIIGEARLSPKQAIDKLSITSQPMRSLKNRAETSNNEKLALIDKEMFKSKMDDALYGLQDKWMKWLDGAEEREEQERLEREQEEQERLEELVSEGYDELDDIEYPVHYMYDHFRWTGAGEPNNTLYSFLANCSQIIMQHPISSIGIGIGGSGKTHIQLAALNCIPEDFVLTEKYSSESALYRMSADNPYFYDGKIVNIGDMGGMKDHEDAQKFKNVMKEMQSDGKTAKTINIQNEEGDWIPTKFELFGTPCLNYTTVPGHHFDDQEQSRSVFIRPRTDNDFHVDLFNAVKEDEDTPDGQLLKEKIDEEAKIQKMVYALRYRNSEIKVINPFRDEIKQFLRGSKYFKRDGPKYTAILKVIAHLNGYKRPLVDNKLFVSKSDVKLFMEILSEYRESITSNLTPGAVDVLNEIRELGDEGKISVTEEQNIEDDNGKWATIDGSSGFTVNEIMQFTTSSLSKKNVQNYFTELNNETYIKQIGGDRRNGYRYVLMEATRNPADVKVELSKMDNILLKRKYPEHYDEILEIIEDEYIPISEYIKGRPIPLWEEMG